MIKSDEITLLILMQIRATERPRAIIASIPHLINEKRALYILGKWTAKGWYDYGTVIDLGWLTPAGKTATLKAEWEKQHPVVSE